MEGNTKRLTHNMRRLQTVGFFFLKISKEIGKAIKRTVKSPQSRSLFSASFQTFCLTAREYLNTQKNTDCFAVHIMRQELFQTFLVEIPKWFSAFLGTSPHGMD